MRFYKLLFIQSLFFLSGMIHKSMFAMQTDPKDPKGYYKTLGVSVDATEEVIKKAYKKLTRKWHPDLNEDKEEANTMMKNINAAYQVLSDSQKRREYDNERKQSTSSNVFSQELFEVIIKNINSKVDLWKLSSQYGIEGALNFAKVDSMQKLCKAINEDFNSIIDTAKKISSIDQFSIITRVYIGMLYVYTDLLGKLLRAKQYRESSQLVQYFFPDIEVKYSNDIFDYKKDEEKQKEVLESWNLHLKNMYSLLNQLSAEFLNLSYMQPKSDKIIQEANKKFVSKEYTIENVLYKYKEAWQILKPAEPFSYGLMLGYYCNFIDLLISKKYSRNQLEDIYYSINYLDTIDGAYKYSIEINRTNAIEYVSYIKAMKDAYQRWVALGEKIEKLPTTDKKQETSDLSRALQHLEKSLKQLSYVVAK